MGSRLNLAVVEENNGNKIRAGKHYLICTKAGYEHSLHAVKDGFRGGFITKDEYAAALRAYQKQHEDRKSAMREEALVYDARLRGKKVQREIKYFHFYSF